MFRSDSIDDYAFIQSADGVCYCAFATLVVFGNMTDYNTNFVFVHHVLQMDTIFPDATISYRAIHSPWLQQLGYIGIILLETLTAVFCWVGGIGLLINRKAPAKVFNRKRVLRLSA